MYTFVQSLMLLSVLLTGIVQLWYTKWSVDSFAANVIYLKHMASCVGIFWLCFY